jgi:hypothetical protein
MTPFEIQMATQGIGVAGNILSGMIGGSELEKQAEIMKQAQRQKQAYMDKGYEDAKALTSDIRGSGMDAWGQMSAGVLNGQFDLPELGNYNFDGDIRDYLDPSRKFQQQEILRGLEGSQAYGGKLKSGASMEALQDRMQDRSMLDWGNANSLMNNDRQFGYQDWINKFNSKTASINDEYNKLADIAQTGVNSTNSLANNRISQANSQGQTAVEMGNISAMGASAPYNNMQNMVGGVQNLLGGAMGGMGGSPTGQRDYTGAMGMQNFDNNAISQFNQQQSNPYGLQAPAFTRNLNLGNL